MATLLAKLRDDLDILPSPLPDHPGLLLRDPLRYSEAAIVLPPLLIRCLSYFDGKHTELDLRAAMTQLTGRIDLNDAADALTRGLSESGFLRDATFRALRADRRRTFAEAPLRPAAFAGGGYPEDHATLEATLTDWMTSSSSSSSVAAALPAPSVTDAGTSAVFAIAAPHASPTGGISSYAAAYGALGPELADRTFVILGTSHYGRPNRFGVTRKPFQTPLGLAPTDVPLVEQLIEAAPRPIDVEDYCHAVEHSIEFQVVFLQHLYGPSVRILPILCGPFIGATNQRTTVGRPEDDPGVARGIEALGELQARHGDRLAWVLGVDMAHVGRRYGDDWEARSNEGVMNDVSARDRARLRHVAEGDADGFWDLLHERGPDDLKWCGSAPLYAFLRAHPGIRGEVLHYDHWNIDEQSVVSFAAMAFHR